MTNPTHQPTIFDAPADFIPDPPADFYGDPYYWQTGYKAGWLDTPYQSYGSRSKTIAYAAGYTQGRADRRMAGPVR